MARKRSSRRGGRKRSSSTRRRHRSRSRSKKGGLFKPPRHKWIADIVSFETPSKARKAARKLLDIMEESRRKKALTILRALNYAANRAEAAAKRRNLSPKERQELKTISEIYREAAEKASKLYHERFSD